MSDNLENGLLLKMAAETKSVRIWVQDLGIGETETKLWQR